MERPIETVVTEERGMPALACRRFTLAEAMLLVAATAPGLVLLRIAAGLGLFTDDPRSEAPPSRQFIEHLSVFGGCILFPLALAVLVLSLRDRRPVRRDVIQGSGFVARVAVAISAILPVARFLVRVGTAPAADISNALPLNFNNMFGSLEKDACLMIVGAWLALAVTGRWQLGPSWTSRLGCVIGVCFVLMYVYTECYFLLLPFFR
jgi:hypothetical protein